MECLPFSVRPRPERDLGINDVVFARLDLKRMDAHGGGVDGEEITVHEVPLAEVDQWLAIQAKAGT